MNLKPIITLFFACSITTGLVFLPARAQEDSSDAPAATEAGPAVKWQHLAFTHDARKFGGAAQLARQINKLGEEGWEMFNVLNFQEEGTTTKTVYHFKRPL